MGSDELEQIQNSLLEYLQYYILPHVHLHLDQLLLPSGVLQLPLHLLVYHLDQSLLLYCTQVGLLEFIRVINESTQITGILQ